LNQIILSLGFGLVTASILAMGSVGFTLQFGVTNLFNLAFGESMTVAAFAAYAAHTGLHWNMWLAMAAGGLVGCSCRSSSTASCTYRSCDGGPPSSPW